jgi:protein-disulfide isomerase
MMRHYPHRAVELLLLSLMLALAGCGREAQPALPEQPFERPAAPDVRAMGDPNAPIVLVEYSDFQCEFCASFVRDTKPQLEENYIKTGKLYFVYRDYPLDIHPGARQASAAANCAADQGSFWPMHDMLYNGAVEREWSAGDAADQAVFQGYARALKLDEGQFESCLDATSSNEQRIQTDLAAGAQHFIQGTPTFLLNGNVVRGSHTYRVWQTLIDDRLAKLGKQ